jgi:RND superfamily putative drug exporter
MSTFLYALGHGVARHRWRTLVVWVLLAVVCFGVSSVAKGALVNDYTIPGTESQHGIDTLDERFPQASGTTGQLVFASTSGPISGHQAPIEDQITAIEKIKHVSSVDDPFASGAVGTISADKTFAQSQIQFDVSVTDLSPATISEVEKAAKTAGGAGYTTTLGGDMYTSTGAGVGLTDLIGVFVAFVVLSVTFGSLVAAGLPLITAALGVGITMSTILTVASVATISTTTPTLALMIGLAVGIDYGLFIVTRHRRQLAHGMGVEESIAQASATAGSAVVFAGVTVIIALCGLAVADIPFLTVMGVAAAAGVAVAVCAALTLLPAFLALCGNRLRPKPTSHAVTLIDKAAAGRTMGARWVAVATRIPALTVAAVLLVIGVLAFPIKDLALALPDNGSADVGSPQRSTFDLISSEFGPGYNAPLLVTADIITSTDPKGTVSELADDIATIPGVAAITKQTPNQTADLGLVRVVPEWSQSDARTTELVGRIRAQAPGWEAKLRISDITVTGQTAVAIDVNSRLSGALVPFGVVVVGLALILLMIVFRSIAVPIKAAFGYLLSIGAALGTVTAAFIWGWGAGPLAITEIGPLVSFLPIILMGVLFGLAMDYEVFLVSAIREDYVHGGGDPQQRARHAIRTGFISSARVVTAAAVIMISVFAAFIPHGSATIKPIALGLAVGVFVDAFLVRMTLVPAVLALLGDRAWWMPKALDKALPHIDVEGSALVRHVEQVEWEETHGVVAVRAEAAGIVTDAGPVPVDLSVPRESTVSYDHPDGAVRAALVWTLGGWRKPVGGHLAVLGRVLPEEAGAVRKVVRVLPTPSRDDDTVDVRRYVSTLLIAQGDRPWPSRRTTNRAIDQADTWLSPLRAPASGEPPLADRRLGDLTALERRLVTLSAAAVQAPELIVVAEPDLDLDPGAMSWFAGVCAELVHDTATTVLLVGSTVTSLADRPVAPAAASSAAASGPSAPDAPTSATPPAPDPESLGFEGVARSADRATPSKPSDFEAAEQEAGEQEAELEGGDRDAEHAAAAYPADPEPEPAPEPPDPSDPDTTQDTDAPRKQAHELSGQ